LLNKRGSYN